MLTIDDLATIRRRAESTETVFTDTDSYDWEEDDWMFIAHACEDILLLLDHIEWLRAKLGEMEDAIP